MISSPPFHPLRRCGIIGFGRIGQLYYSLLTDPTGPSNISVVAIADSLPVRGPAGVRFCHDHFELLELELEVVFIATPPATHYEIARAALLSGKDVLVEKPATHSFARAEELKQISIEHNSVLFFAFHARYNVSVLHATSHIRQETVRWFDVIYRENVLKFHANEWVLSEGVLWDSGINVFSVISAFLPAGPNLEILSSELSSDSESGAAIRAHIEFALRGEQAGALRMDWRHGGEETRSLMVVTDRHEWRIDIVHDALHCDGRLVELPPGGGQLGGEYARMIKDFAQCLRHRRSLCDLEPIRLTEAAHRRPDGHAPVRT